jgi:hypothetical protein
MKEMDIEYPVLSMDYYVVISSQHVAVFNERCI